MRIAEIYRSVQGEGLLTGTESVFLRASGCNLRCWFCDTPYTSWKPEGEDLAIEEIARQVLDLGSSHVVITGGEPMLFAELIPLTERLRSAGRHLTIETAGTLYLPVTCDLMSISPKLSSSTPSVAMAGAWSARHERTRDASEVVRQLIADYPYQLKFVIDTPTDCEEVEQYLRKLVLPCTDSKERVHPCGNRLNELRAGLNVDRARVLLMPQGIVPAQLMATSAWLEPYCGEHGLTFCPRRHIEWFGTSRGT